MQSHKLSLKQDEDNLKRIRVCRDDFWNESIVSFKNPEFDCSARPRVVFEGEAGVDAGGLKREYGARWPIMQVFHVLAPQYTTTFPLHLLPLTAAQLMTLSTWTSRS